MKITKTITLNIEKEGNYIICRDLNTLCLIMGTKGVGGSMHIYNIERKKGKYYIPLSVIKERVKTLSLRKQQIEQSLEIMEQVVK